jgi:hypothetical protein
MSKPRNPTREERRAAALTGTPSADAQVAAIAFVLRRGATPSWLLREAPSVAWGPRDKAMRFGTRDEARAALARLATHRGLVVEEIAG